MTKQTSNKVTKDAVLALINETLTDPTTGETLPTPRASKAIERALVALYAKQTGDERASKSTNHDNGQGFTGVDAQFLSDLAETVLGIGEWTHRETGRRYARKGPRNLTLGQLKAARKQLQKYGTQLAGIANAKAAAKAELENDLSEQASIEAERAAELANERSFEERGWTPDPVEEALWQTDPQVNGEHGLSIELEAAVGTPADQMRDEADRLSTKLQDLDRLIKQHEADVVALKASMTRTAEELGAHLGRMMAAGVGYEEPRHPAPAVETPKVNPVHLPTADEVPMADPDLRKEDEPTEEPEDDFDRIFGKPEPRTPSARTSMSVTESVEMWAERTYGNRFDGRGGNGRGGRKTEPTRFEMALKAIPVG